MACPSRLLNVAVDGRIGKHGCEDENNRQRSVEHPIVIAIDGTSASGKSTNSKLVAKALGFTHVDTGAMYRALAWYCLKQNVDVTDPKAVAAACRRWKTELKNIDNHV